MSSLKVLLFDLDGTLVQTREISWQIFQETNAALGLGVGSAEEFYELFDGNFFESLEALATARGVEDPEEVREHFQRRLRSDYLPKLVPGIAGVIRKLASSYTLMIVSSNTMESVRRILESTSLAACFAHVFSGEVAPSKQRAINYVLADATYSCGRQCVPYYDESAAPHEHATGEVMLITDTVGDVTEALKAGIRACGVAWGMHSAERLKAAGAEFVCIWPEELLVYLRDGPSSPAQAANSAADSPANSVANSVAASASTATQVQAPVADLRAAVEAAAARRRARRSRPTAGAPSAARTTTAGSRAQDSPEGPRQEGSDEVLRRALRAIGSSTSSR